jgi:hypothetical protein
MYVCIIVPIGTRVDMVTSYLQSNGIECLEAHVNSSSTAAAMSARITHATKRLGIIRITYSNVCSNDDIITCLHRLCVDAHPHIRHLLMGAHVHITHQRLYHVDEFGTIHIPLHWT